MNLKTDIKPNTLGGVTTAYIENDILTAAFYDSMGNLIDLHIVTNNEKIEEVDEKDC